MKEVETQFEADKGKSTTHLFQFRIRFVRDLLGDVVNVGAGGTREPERIGPLLHAEDVGARRAE